MTKKIIVIKVERPCIEDINLSLSSSYLVIALKITPPARFKVTIMLIIEYHEL